jgi:hypothetical protein
MFGRIGRSTSRKGGHARRSYLAKLIRARIGNGADRGIPKREQFGRLPGDIRFQRGGAMFYFRIYSVGRSGRVRLSSGSGREQLNSSQCLNHPRPILLAQTNLGEETMTGERSYVSG